MILVQVLENRATTKFLSQWSKGKMTGMTVVTSITKVMAVTVVRKVIRRLTEDPYYAGEGLSLDNAHTGSGKAMQHGNTSV